MSQNAPEVSFSQEEATLAAQQEENERALAENRHFLGRLALLRAYVNRLQSENNELRAENERLKEAAKKPRPRKSTVPPKKTS